MAWVSVTNIESYLDDAPVGFSQQTPSLLQSRMNEVLGVCETDRLLEKRG
jgi:hypothetical protein